MILIIIAVVVFIHHRNDDLGNQSLPVISDDQHGEETDGGGRVVEVPTIATWKKRRDHHLDG